MEALNAPLATPQNLLKYQMLKQNKEEKLLG